MKFSKEKIKTLELELESEQNANNSILAEQ